jgi:cytochrome c oxidase assembly protein subunit 15
LIVSRALIWLRRLAFSSLLLCFVVVVLGAYVRLSAAGLGCPDWPGCYGHLTPIGAEQNAAAQAAFPNTPLHAGKAWREMVHRYAASTLGLLIIGMAVIAIVKRRQRLLSVPFALGLVALVIFQGILGMLTVTWQLKPLIVTLHLIFGLTTLSLLWWLWLSLMRAARGDIRFGGATRASVRVRAAQLRTPRRLVLAALTLLGIQIVLGGWTSSNYAAVACLDFPTCQREWWPTMDFGDAFVLWRGLGINYEGGVLDHPARTAIHFMHRLGALLATLAAVIAAVVVMRRRLSAAAMAAATGVLVALALQLAIGIAMVLEAFPLGLATAHNAGAAVLLLATLALQRQLSGSD